MQFETQQRIALYRRRQHGAEPVVDRIGHSADVQQPGDLGVQLLRRPFDTLGRAQHLVRVSEQLPAGFGQHHPGRGAFEQSNVQFLLQRLDVAADGGLAQMETLGRTRQMPFFGHCSKRSQLVKLHTAFS